MTWNWQKKNWPNFTYKKEILAPLENKFIEKLGEFKGSIKYISEGEKNKLIINLFSNEAISTSQIEGEYLDRDSVQSSIRKHFGIIGKNIKVGNKEKGVSQMVLNNYETYQDNLTNEYLFNWHKLLMQGQSHIQNVGKYRTHKDEMLVVSGNAFEPKIHFQAPPSNLVPKEMEKFIDWFESSRFQNSNELSALIRCGLAHLYFLTIHPFEDGNGRIARNLSEKVLSQSLGQPILISLSTVINKNKKDYYQKLSESNRSLEVTDWLLYFAQVILEAQEHTQKVLDSTITKTKIFDKFKSELNNRQSKVLNKLFENNISEGFKGGLSNNNYVAITKTSIATATRDLNELVEKRILFKTGDKRYARYFLNSL